MTHISRNVPTKKVVDDIMRRFITALATLDEKSATPFFNRFFSQAERIMFAKRFATLFLLDQGWSSYRIAALLKMSASGIRNIGREFSGVERTRLVKAFSKTQRGSALLSELGDLLVRGFSMDPKKRSAWLREFESRYE